MSIRFRSNNSQDFDIVNQDLVLIEGVESFKQGITELFRTFFGEWFLNRSLGIPYYESVIGKFNNPSYIQAIFVNEVTNYPGVSELKNLNLELEDRSLTVTMEIVYNNELVTIDEALEV